MFKYSQIGDGTEVKKRRKVALEEYELVAWSIANVGNRFIYLTGGKYESHGTVHIRYELTTFRYDIKANRWETAPDLNEHRIDHSSCVQGNNLFVFGGWARGSSDTFEVLDTAAET